MQDILDIHGGLGFTIYFWNKSRSGTGRSKNKGEQRYKKSLMHVVLG